MMTAQYPSDAVDISGLVVYAAPDRGNEVAERLRALAGVTVHASTAEGKLIVTLETRGAGEGMALYEHIQRMQGVTAVALAYHRIETEPDEEIPS